MAPCATEMVGSPFDSLSSHIHGRCDICGEDLQGLDGTERIVHREACAKFASSHLDNNPSCSASLLHIVAQPPNTGAGPACEDSRGRSSCAAFTQADSSDADVAAQIATVEEKSVSSCWRLATSMKPNEYACNALSEFIPTFTSVEPTPEGLRCDSCQHYIRVEHGVQWDLHGNGCCQSCAASLNQSRSSGRVEHTIQGLDEGSVTSLVQMLAWRDHRAALDWLDRLHRVQDPRAKSLQTNADAAQLSMPDVAAQGVLAAFLEAERACEASLSSQSGSGDYYVTAAFDHLASSWDAQIPMGILMLLQSKMSGEQEAANRMPHLIDELRRVRSWYGSIYHARGLRISNVVHATFHAA